MQILEADKKKYQVPETWDELTAKQYLNICHVISVDMRDEEQRLKKQKGIEINSEYSKRIVILKVLASMPWRKFAKLNKLQLASIIHLTDFVMEEVTITNQLLPKIRVGLRYYYGPEKGLVFSTFEEFAHADTQFTNYVNGKREEALGNLIAVLYRPRKRFLWIRKRLPSYNGDPRIPFNDTSVAKRGKRFTKRMKNRYKHAVLFFFAGFRSQNVIKNYAELFKQRSGTVKFGGKNYGWKSPLHEMAGNKYGSMKETSSYRWHEILTALVMEVENAERRTK
jgi:hypothetical protein